MAVSTKTFSQFVSDSVAAIQGMASQLVDMTVGSVLRSFVDAYNLLALWFQGVALQLASMMRLATSSGADVDSFLADFGAEREGGSNASGPVTFSRFTPTAIATINVGQIVQTPTGVQYQTIADTTQAAFDATLNAYVIPAGAASITATVEALEAGSAGNAVDGLINTIASAIPGVDTVTNPAAFENGTDPQTDAEAKAAFPGFLQSLSSATPAAIKRAIQKLGLNVNFTYTENQTLAGLPQPGFFFIIADNGTGSPPSSFLTAVFNAVDAVRGDSISFAVFPPTILAATVVMAITTDANTVHATAVAAVEAALEKFINTLPIGAPLPFTILASIAYGVSGVTNVTGVTLNGGTADLVPTATQIVKIGTPTVS